MKSSRKRPLGTGVSVRDWIAQNPDLHVTRSDMGLLFAMYESAQQRARRAGRWYRRLWRYLTTPILGQEAPSTPLPPVSSSPSSSPSSPPASSSVSGGASGDGASPPNASPPPAAPANPSLDDFPTK